MVGDTGVAAALLGLVILELLLINFVYMIMLQNAHIPAKAIPGFNSSHEYLSASRSPLFKPPSGEKVVELFRNLGGSLGKEIRMEMYMLKCSRLATSDAI